MSQTLTTSGDPKGLQIANLFDAALNKAKLDQERAQRLIENGGEFQDGLAALIERFSATNQYADEEMESRHGYLSGYKPKEIAEQTNRLRQLFPGIGYANEKLAEGRLPGGAEGYFAIPRWKKVAETYPEAVQLVLDSIKQTRNGRFCNWYEGQIDEKRIRQLAKPAKMQKRLGEEQEGYDILVVPCQFGLRHRGRSVRRARDVMNPKEFGLGAFAIGMMLLTQPERLQYYKDLWIDCAGDEFSDEDDGQFERAPYFNFSDGKVKFGARWFGGADSRYGSASALLPQ